MSGTILTNRARCRRCGDEIESKHRHDYVACSCGAVAVDGGHAYLRRVGEPDACEELSEYAPWEEVAEAVAWWQSAHTGMRLTCRRTYEERCSLPLAYNPAAKGLECECGYMQAVPPMVVWGYRAHKEKEGRP